MTAAHKLRLDEQLCFALYAATNAITRVYRPLLEALGLTYPQYLVLMVLWERGAQPIGEIAHHLGLPPNALSPLIKRLEVAGLVRRKTDLKDRRSIAVFLTNEGFALERAASRTQSTVACRTRLSSKKFIALREQLHELVENLGEGVLAESC